MTFKFKPVVDGSQAHEKIVAQIRRAIFNKEIPPGDRLPSERDLAKTFNTSRVSIRSAILTLKNTGLVYVKKGAGGGTFVTEDIGAGKISELLHDIIRWKSISIRHVIDVRDMIEPKIAYFAALNRTDADMEKIWECINSLDRSFKQKKVFQSKDELFHKALADAANNPLLSIFQAALIDLLFKFISSIKWEDREKESISSYHRKVAEKVEIGDPEGAYDMMTEHLADMREILVRYPLGDVLK